MQDLHVVGRSRDGAVLLAAEPNGRPTHRVRNAASLRAALVAADEQATAARTASRPRHPRTVLSPAELQARMRAGVSIDELARSTGMPAADIERWAGPVEAERARVLGAALASRVTGDAGLVSRRPLGELVVPRPDDDVTWSATRRQDGRWRVLLQVERGGRVLTASWVHDLTTGQLVAASARARTLSFPAR